ncbi:hypothetical protein C8Q77DRAFT_1037027, partial [Trametes polyzona]
ARGDDLARLRDRVIVLIDPGLSEILKIKTSRGFKHLITARLLCPMRLLAQFDKDPEAFCRGVRNGTIPIISCDWPSFLYDETLAVPGKVKPGFLRSQLLLQAGAFKIVFTGPQSVDVDFKEASKTTGKPSLAKKYGMQSSLREQICYVASLASWAIKDGHFKGPEFVRSILRVFEGHRGWGDRTLAWFDEWVLSNEPTAISN